MQPGQPRRVDRWFGDYASQHRHPGNRLCHGFGVPMIAIGLLGMLSRVRFGPLPGFAPLEPWARLDLGFGLWALACALYLLLDWKLALPFGLFSLGWYLIGGALSIPVLVALFVVGWVIQLVGHRHYEKNRPAFLSNVLHLLVGPFWLFSEWTGYPSASNSAFDTAPRGE